MNQGSLLFHCSCLLCFTDNLQLETLRFTWENMRIKKPKEIMHRIRPLKKEKENGDFAKDCNKKLCRKTVGFLCTTS